MENKSLEQISVENTEHVLNIPAVDWQLIQGVLPIIPVFQADKENENESTYGTFSISVK